MGQVIPGSQVDSLNIGGRTFTDLKNLIVLRTNTTDAAYNCTARLHKVSSGYQVPVGKQLRVLGVIMRSTLTAAVGVAPGMMNLLQSDNDVGFGSTTAFTNGSSVKVFGSGLVPSTKGYYEEPINFVVAAGKYLSFTQNYVAAAATVTCEVYGYLENV